MTTRNAACSCGKLTLLAEGEPIRVSICHCLACQKRTGSVFAAQARFTEDKVTVEGPSSAYVRIGDEGGQITFHFCPECGSTVYYTIDGLPGQIAVPVGAFADPTFPTPQVAVYASRKHAWVALPAEIEPLD